MNACLKVILFLHLVTFVVISVLLVAVWTDRLPPVPETPQIHRKWFGKQSAYTDKVVKTVKPFKIKVDEKDLVDLKQRINLDLQRIGPPLEGVAFNYGFNTDYLREIGKYWLNEFDWRAQEKKLNAFPQFVTHIDGIDLHFLHVKPDAKLSKGKKVFPLLLIHGWPGSIVEFTKVIPMLTTPREDSDFVFEVIAPSLPGYGWSSAAAQPGLNGAHCARMFIELMKDRLGFKDKFYVHGGDWGSLITTHMGTIYPEELKGIHITMAMFNNFGNSLRMILAAILPSNWIVDEKEEYKILPIGEKFKELFLEMGYLHIQATKPDTVGVGLSNSPLGLTSYILEKYSTWTKKTNRDAPDGNLTKKFNLDELLTMVMAYWSTNSITSSMRFYAENLAFSQLDADLERIPIRDLPVGMANFPNEIALLPKSFAEVKYNNIVTYTDMEDGGHFAAFEEPKLVARELFKFVKEAEKSWKAKAKGKSEL